jgi:menaquinone-dependent protoporphyrinogen oxidase
MKPILVLYATREGQTRRIAEHIGAELRAHDFEADVLDAAKLPSAFTLARYDAAILAASVHIGKHEPEMVAFVKAHRSELERIPAPFLSVSGAESGAENSAASPEARERSAANVKKMIDAFVQETGWHPARVFPVAGALLYREYNPFLRFIMRLIAKSEGGSTDTSRNTEYTDWESLDQFVDGWTAEVGDEAAVGSALQAPTTNPAPKPSP